MNYNQIAEKIEKIVNERLEHGFDAPAALLLGPEDWNTFKQRMEMYNSGPKNMGYTTMAFVTSGGRVDLMCKKHVMSGDLVPVNAGQDPEDAYKDYYVGRIDRELNDIVYRIVEEEE